jgi:alginate O-acetyltransferase complex protein AlgI
LDTTNFQNWFLLILYLVPLLLVRYAGKRFNLWRDDFDRFGLLFLSLMLFFYGSGSRTSFAILIFGIVFNYLIVRLMQQREGWQAKAIAGVAIAFDVGVLVYFKYRGFLFGIKGGLLPLGISFFTFTMVAFVVDTLNTKKKKQQPVGFFDFANFVTFFPNIVAGPIERKSTLYNQLSKFNFKFSAENLEMGLRWLALGLFMKFALADNITPFIKYEEIANAWMVWFSAYLFTLRIYFDFAGYSFMAVGIAKALGVKLTLNFLAPYTATSIQEFWRRWHISLNNWFRDYVFIPLMGSKKEWAELFLFITFTLSGLWHGAAWNFVIWGAYHGLLLLILRYTSRSSGFLGKRLVMPEFVSWAVTFGCVVFGGLFFMETNFGRLGQKLLTLVTPWAYSLQNIGDVFSAFSFNELAALGFTLVLANAVLFLENLAVWQKREPYDLLLSPWVGRVLLGLTLLLAANTPSPFIYTNF